MRGNILPSLNKVLLRLVWVSMIAESFSHCWRHPATCITRNDLIFSTRRRNKFVSSRLVFPFFTHDLTIVTSSLLAKAPLVSRPIKLVLPVAPEVNSSLAWPPTEKGWLEPHPTLTDLPTRSFWICSLHINQLSAEFWKRGGWCYLAYSRSSTSPRPVTGPSMRSEDPR